MALKNLAHAALLALALGAAGAAAQTQAFDPQSEKAGTSCIGYRFTVADSGMKSAQPINASVAFDQDGVQQHFEAIEPVDDWRDNTKSMFSCVDSRGEFNELGTPGGDIAEFAGAVYNYFDHTGTPFKYETVKDALHKFIPKVASPERRFYFHTSDEKLNKIFHHLAEGDVARKPTVFPEMMPTDAKTRDAWLDALTTGKYQGCGHMRLLIEQFANFGLKSADVPRAVVRAFFEYWWPTPPGSAERGRVKMTIVQGPLDGKAIAIVDGQGCPGRSPAVAPSHGGSQIFLLHAKAVDDFRKKVLTPFFADFAKAAGRPFDSDKFYNSLKSLQTKQLGAVLTYLPPANALPIYGVNVMAMPTNKTPTTRAANTRPNLANPAGRRTGL